LAFIVVPHLPAFSALCHTGRNCWKFTSFMSKMGSRTSASFCWIIRNCFYCECK